MAPGRDFSAYPPAVAEGVQLDHLRRQIADWAIAHGLAVRPAAVTERLQEVLALPAPVTLFPSLFPRTCFEAAAEVQTTYNALYAAVASDVDWLGGVIEE